MSFKKREWFKIGRNGCVSLEDGQKIESFCEKHEIKCWWRYDELWGELQLLTRNTEQSWRYHIPWDQPFDANGIIDKIEKVYDLKGEE